MSELNEAGPSPRANPLIWITLIVIGVIAYVLFSGDRGGRLPGNDPDTSAEAVDTVASVEASVSAGEDETGGSIERSLLVPPGMRARDYIKDLRSQGKPYPLEQIYEKAQQHLQEGSLADAHLLYFFAAREDHLPSIMKLAEMSDPNLFRAEDALMDDADVIQAYKWYSKAAELGHQPANERVDGLHQWASNAAADGDPDARQLLLNFRKVNE